MACLIPPRNSKLWLTTPIVPKLHGSVHRLLHLAARDGRHVELLMGHYK
jgi:hypothetical protein